MISVVPDERIIMNLSIVYAFDDHPSDRCCCRKNRDRYRVIA